MPSTIRTMDEFKDALYAFRLPRVLATALELDVFTRMGARSWTPGALAGALKADARAVDILLRNLETAGLVHRRGAAYGAGTLARAHLNRNSPECHGAYLDLLQHQWEQWARLPAVVRTGKPVEGNGPDDPAYRRSFTWAMHQRSLKPAKQVAAQLDLKHARSLLDVGGGPGTYAMEFLKRHPRLRAGVWDRKAALAVARQLAKPLRCRARFSCYPGDLFDDPVPGTFDVLWLSNVLHLFSPAENMTLFRKLKRGLNPGGRIFLQDTFLMNANAAGCDAMETNLFAVTMLLYTPAGNTYRATDVQRWLTTCGFRRPRCLRLKHGTGDWDGVIIEAIRR